MAAFQKLLQDYQRGSGNASASCSILNGEQSLSHSPPVHKARKVLGRKAELRAQKILASLDRYAADREDDELGRSLRLTQTELDATRMELQKISL